MKITIFIGSLFGGGAERVACCLANHLSMRYDVDLLTISKKKAAYSIRSQVNIITLTPPNRLLATIGGAYKLFNLFRYVFLNKNNTYVVFLPRPTFLLLKFRKIIKGKIICGQRIEPSALKHETQTTLRKIANRADAWVFQTEEQKKWFKNILKDIPECVIPNAINEEFSNVQIPEKREQIIVTSGRMTNQKNQKLLIKAFGKIASRYPNLNLWIYGEGSLKVELSQLVTRCNLEGRVFMPGYTTDIKNKIKAAKLFVLSSDYEGMPNALMEAMALGVPCISTDCGGGGARFLIENEKNGLLVPIQDVDALANAMDRMLSNREFAESLGREAHKLCETLASEKIYGMWEQFIEDVVNKK